MKAKLVALHEIEVPFYAGPPFRAVDEARSSEPIGTIMVSKRVHDLLISDEYWGRKCLLVYAHDKYGRKSPRRMYFYRYRDGRDWYLTTTLAEDTVRIQQAGGELLFTGTLLSDD